MAKRLIDSVGNAVSRVSTTVGNLLPDLPDFALSKRVGIPIYIVHNSTNPEDYFFLLDFERFMAESQKGMFTRPSLELWAGRSDFERHPFARNLREAFSREFGRMHEEKRADLSKKRWGSGWLSLGFGLDIVAALGSGFVQTLILFLAVTTGKSAWKEVRNILGMKSRKESELKKLQTAIDEKREVIDAALMEIDVTLHRELYLHAYRGHPPGKLTGMDYQAWPLPNFVRQHLEQGVSRGWW